ncbi:MAG TPA: BTAD domain-containing putative transcriptional regulator [Planosporangium sp.]|nr:BTAD domain-containing putative transcriptional regulator [Planosporangium sp.]
MEYRILGPLDVRANGRALDLGGVRSRRILAALLLDANRPVSVERLSRIVWAADLPATARHQVQNRVAALRRVLGPQALRTVPGGYQLCASVEQVDALRFEKLVKKADDASDARLYREALGLWRGPVLDGLFGEQDVTALEERRLSVLERCIELELSEGRHEQLVAELTDLVARHPLRQRLVGLLMTALYRTGRQAEALTAYRDLAARLADETGLDPNADLRRLHVRMLRADLPSPPPRRRPHTLPRAIPDFVGRDATVSQVLKVRDSDLVLIDGMAGAGKTTLAVRVAHLLTDRYPDARLYIDLHGHSERDPVEPTTALETLLRQLGVPAERIPEGLDERVALWRTQTVGRRALIVLDNARDSAQVAPLLPGGSSCLVFVTSRRRLAGLDGARSLSLDVLPAGEAVALLARVAGPRVTADPAGAADVARLCGYLPLALRLAAARLAHRPRWSVADLVCRLRDGLAVAAEGRTVQAAFDLSYQQLDATAKLVFRRLGPHPAGEFGEYVVAALADLPLRETREALEDLVDAHLIESPSVGRYRLHELFRDYTAGLSDGDPEREGALRRMCDFYIHATAAAKLWIETAHHRLDVPTDAPAVLLPPMLNALQGGAWLDVERTNVLAVFRLAYELGRHRDVCLLARVVWPYLYEHEYWTDLIDTQRRALEAATVLGDAALIGSAHNYLASGYWRQGRYAECVAHLERALAARRSVGDRQGEAGTLSNLGNALSKLGRFVEALDRYSQAITLWQATRTEQIATSSRIGTGIVLTLLGRYDEALSYLRFDLARNRLTGKTSEVANAIGELGYLHLRRGDFRLAELLLRRTRTMKRGLKNRYGEAETLSRLGSVYCGLGRYDEAVECQREALAIMADVGAPGGECHALNGLGRTLTALGRFDEAAELLARAVTQAERINERVELAQAHDGLAAAIVATDPDRARQHWRAALELYADMQLPERHTVAERLAGLDRR